MAPDLSNSTQVLGKSMSSGKLSLVYDLLLATSLPKADVPSHYIGAGQ